ncbi:MAG TPA: CoA transferase [Candidatus Binataceae bacterium]|nr:CoA transferase [Candidatus Binataceae bacterium]
MAELPLAGIRVLDLTTFWAGPGAAMVFADLGAEVIKVEAVQRLDNWRALLSDPQAERWWETSPTFNSINRNKYGITLNLARPRGAELFKLLVKRSDFVWENYSTRVMAQFGLSYEVLSEINPRIIVVSQSGFGSTGPWRDYISFDPVAQALAGLASITGAPDSPPAFAGQMPADMLSARHAALAGLIALADRERTGRGQHIDMSQLETAIPAISEALLDYQMNGRVWNGAGNRHPQMAPHGCYPARGNNQWVVIAVATDDEWRRLVAVIGNPPWTSDKRFATIVLRLANAADLDRLLADWTREHDRDDLFRRLQAARVKAAPVLNAADLLDDPHLGARGFFEMVERAEVGRKPYPSLGIRFSKIPISIRKPAPTLGEDNEKVLGGLLGLSAQELAELEREEIIGKFPLGALPSIR